MKIISVTLIILLCFWILTACQTAVNDTEIGPATGTPIPTPELVTNTASNTPSILGTSTPLPSPTLSVFSERTPTSSSFSRSSGSRVEILIQLAREDLAQRLDVKESEIEVISITGDEGPADTLGCPALEKETRPIPAFATFTIITLENAGTTYVYYGRGGQVTFCETD